MAAKRKRSPAAPAAPDARPARSRGVHVAALGALLVAAGLWAYSNSFDGVLVLDDLRAIALNPAIRSLESALAPPSANTVSGRPVANLSFAVNYWLAPVEVRDAFLPDPATPDENLDAIRRNLWGYHAANLAIHLAAGLLLFGAVRRTLARLDAGVPAEGGGGGTRSPGPAALAAAAAVLWVVHPLQTESVTYLVQRVESLMALFYLATLYAAIRSADGRARASWAAVAMAACALGMATKEVMVTAPLIVVLWDWVFGPRPVPRSRRWLWAGLAATWLVLAALVWNEHRAPSIGSGSELAWRYLLAQSAVIVHYLRLSFVPAPLVFLYTWPLPGSVADVWPQLAAVGALAALTVVGLARRTPLAFAGAWFFLILAPTSSVLPIITEIAAEHRMYLPLAAVLACVVIACAALVRRIVARVPATAAWRALPAATAGVLLAAATIVLGLETRDRNRDYHSDAALWGDTVEKQPDNPRARTAYGVALFAQHRLQDAETQLVEAIRLAPSDAVARVRLGGLLASQGRLTEAIDHLEQAARFTRRGDPQVLGVLAAALAQQGRFLPAAAAADEARQAALAQGLPDLADDLARRAAAYRARAGAF